MPFRAFFPPKSPVQTSRTQKTAAHLHPSRRRAALCKMRSVPLRKPPHPGYAKVPAAAPPRASPARPYASLRCARATAIRAFLLQNRSSKAARTQKSRRAIPAFSGLRGGFSHIYAFASVSMAWAKILTLSMNFSQSIYSSGIWQVSVSPGKLMPKATVLGIMRE